MGASGACRLAGRLGTRREDADCRLAGRLGQQLEHGIPIALGMPRQLL
eukprot:CAMPEP_0197926728 /NCGR_PEP_ID=MMETSP1439-20131203/99588_1 /TAXON_ID=66791 /ORGANISM="Gonyaulax spinifera, Strain CCMP409" /LENGTH=47 /DNA_ID= /DNA_START= /DNA_END= /DNA_ORIENTATION=